METTLLDARSVRIWIGLFLMAVFFTSCSEQVERTGTYETQVPVYMKISAFRAMSVDVAPPKNIDAAGKIYVYGDYLFINEPKEGIHVIDNRNPSRPNTINFIKIPGNVDIAVNSNILYADSYIDLLAFNISDINDIKLVHREENVFPHMIAHYMEDTFITYKDTTITYSYTEDSPSVWTRWWGFDRGFSNAMLSSSSDASGSYGQGGSLARFTLMSGHLYAVDDYTLRLFDVRQPSQPTFVKDISLGWGIETIFPYKGNLFIGSTTGMHIYSAANPTNPERLSVYAHATACDPVVVNDEYAFVTLRSGNLCRQGADQLEVIDIKDLRNPKLLKAYDMDNPHGLGLHGDYLYICEGDYGLKSFDASDVHAIGSKLIEHHKNRSAVDIIPAPKSLIVTGKGGVYQYDYSNPRRLNLLSSINVY